MEMMIPRRRVIQGVLSSVLGFKIVSNKVFADDNANLKTSLAIGVVVGETLLLFPHPISKIAGATLAVGSKLVVIYLDSNGHELQEVMQLTAEQFESIQKAGKTIFRPPTGPDFEMFLKAAKAIKRAAKKNK